MSGFVSFVGAGPGDPDLLTIKAAARLDAADAILFDDLASRTILDRARPDVKLVPVGKRAGRPSPTQAEVNRQLVEHAQTGLRVVRLKSGDAGIFGRLEEEIDALRKAGIAFEIVPGVSAASAAAAAIGIPLTRREQARRVQFVTGHGVNGQLPDDLNMAALADPRATTVVYMARRTFPALVERLLESGMAPETPAILAENVGHQDQRITKSSITGLARVLAEGGPSDPAIVLYGPLAEEA
ncbi:MULTISPECIES: uroporphyrinogen-III C-methyltransferase [Pseudomonadota]|jgi:uroporphyrin-III C-methyltransferase|uniref:uroporphyrinogen-III C-methyltransferase n=1 Tax=Pseudomonadota TaxID=1224 RepID=UPI00076A8806|nr:MULTISPECIES: uroporphyrinogen-III C-methyltransferase [Pseudomonadota]PZP18706.1 MAG: uroporphyrinogen-III C-methyltransferase [Sphingomonas hengshuiensis]